MSFKLKIGIDVGGTFTDFAFFKDGAVRVHKVPSRPENPVLAIVQGVSHLSKNFPENFEVIHGTTVATNTLIERKGAKTVFVTTRGFEDIIEIGRQNRGSLYDLFWEKDKSLTPRSMRVGAKERIGPDGAVAVPFSDKELKKLREAVEKLGAESAAVCFLHSYANPSHELEAARKIRELGIAVSVSSNVSPEFREYERASTTVANSYLIPKVANYMKSLSSSLGRAKVSIVQSSGGITSPDKVADEPVKIATSGPAAGVIGAFKTAEKTGETKIITLDMGGTSTDVSLCDGAPAFAAQSSVGGIPLRVPCVDIATIGAGGGSIARIDSGGILKTGPQSAGAEPGPACYGKGNFPTVTDANVVLGRIDAERFLGGRKKIFPQRAHAAIQNLEMGSKDVLQKAESVIKVVNSSMERLIRVIAADRGVDIREFSLFGFGGAAGLHCCELALETGMEKVIFPAYPAALSALGMLLSDIYTDYVKSFFANPEDETGKVPDALGELENKARAEHGEGGDFQTQRFVDMRYRGQSHEITVPFSGELVSAFHLLHFQRFGYSMPDRPVETTSVRIRFHSGKSLAETPEIRPYGGKPPGTREKEIWAGGALKSFKVYERPELEAGFRFDGPALVLENSSVLIITREFECETDRWGNIKASLK